MKKLKKKQRMHNRLQISAAILARWWRSVASTKALDLLHQAMRAVLYRRTTTARKMASKVGAFFHCCFVCCCYGSRRGNMERVVP